jgi:hypothetical protein
MKIEMIEVICIKEYEFIQQGKIYLTTDDYHTLPIGAIIFVYDEYDEYRIPIGGYLKECFTTLAELREQQIKSVIDD